MSGSGAGTRRAWAGILTNLAWVLATRRSGVTQGTAEAIQLAQKACEVSAWKEALFLDTLGAAYAAADRFDEAKEVADRAASLAEESGWTELAAKIRKRRDLYGKGQAYQELDR